MTTLDQSRQCEEEFPRPAHHAVFCFDSGSERTSRKTCLEDPPRTWGQSRATSGEVRCQDTSSTLRLDLLALLAVSNVTSAFALTFPFARVTIRSRHIPLTLPQKDQKICAVCFLFLRDYFSSWHVDALERSSSGCETGVDYTVSDRDALHHLSSRKTKVRDASRVTT